MDVRHWCIHSRGPRLTQVGYNPQRHSPIDGGRNRRNRNLGIDLSADRPSSHFRRPRSLRYAEHITFLLQPLEHHSQGLFIITLTLPCPRDSQTRHGPQPPTSILLAPSPMLLLGLAQITEGPSQSRPPSSMTSDHPSDHLSNWLFQVTPVPPGPRTPGLQTASQEERLPSPRTGPLYYGGRKPTAF